MLPVQAQWVFYTGNFVAEAVGATGSGNLNLKYDDERRTLLIMATWWSLSGATTMAHTHCCNAAPLTGTWGVALAQTGNLPAFSAGVSTGSYSRVIDLTQSNQYSGAFLAAVGGTTALAEARLMANLASGNAHLDIHASRFGGGEIGAFVTGMTVPEPGSLALVLGARCSPQLVWQWARAADVAELDGDSRCAECVKAAPAPRLQPA